MKSLIKKIFIFLLTVIVLVLVVFVSIGKKPLNTFVEQQLISAAQQQGIRLAFEGTDIGIRSMSAKSAEVFISQLLLLLPFDNVSLTPIWSSLLNGSLDTVLSTQFAGTDTTMQITGISSRGATISGHFQKLDIASIQQVALLGITKGVAEFRAEKVRFDSNQDFPTEGTIGIAIHQIEKPGQSSIPIPVGDLALTLQLPALSRGKIESIVNFGDRERAIIVRKFDFLSSWGAVSLSGDMTATREISFKGEVHFSDEGSAAFRSFLPLISQGKLKYETKSFSFTVNGPSRRPKVQFTDLG